MTETEVGILAPGRIAPRISIRAVAAGAVVAMSTWGLAMEVGGGVGLWRLGVATPDTVVALDRGGVGLAIWGIVTWAVATFLGGWTAAALAGARDTRDGQFHGFVTWASASLLLGVLGGAWLLGSVAVGLVEPAVFVQVGNYSGGVFWAFALLDAAGIAGSVVGGRFGSHVEATHPLEVPTFGETPVTREIPVTRDTTEITP